MADDQRLRELMREYQSGRFEAFDDIYASIAPAVRRYLSSPVSLEDVVNRIAVAHARPNPSFVEHVRQFSPLAPSLIQATQDQVRDPP